MTTGGDLTAEFLDGPAADDDAPDGFVGRFTKTWKEPDPSQRQVLMESNAMPVLYQPDHVLIVRVY
jgi:hypothetical protein